MNESSFYYRIGNGKTGKIFIDKEWLRNKYFNEKLSIDAISLETKISKSVLQKRFKFFGFKALTLSEARKQSKRWSPKRGPASNFFKLGLRNREGYIQVLCPDHHDSDKCGYVFLHRILAEVKVKRKLKKQEHVHHIDENILNNNLSNLEVLSNREHMSIHMKKANKNKRSEVK